MVRCSISGASVLTPNKYLNRWDLGEVFSDFFLGRVFKRPALLKLFFCQYLLGRDHVQNRFNAPR